MTGLLAPVVALGLAGAFTPGRMLLVLAILAAPMGKIRAWFFVLGYTGSLSVACALAFWTVQRIDRTFDWRIIAVASMVIGALFLITAAYFAVCAVRGIPTPAQRLMVTNLSLAQAVGLGAVSGACGPRLLTILTSGVVIIVAGTSSPPMQMLAAFVLIATASAGVVLPPLIVTLVRGEPASLALARVQTFLTRHATVAVIGIAALLGLTYAVYGISRLR